MKPGDRSTQFNRGTQSNPSARLNPIAHLARRVAPSQWFSAASDGDDGSGDDGSKNPPMPTSRRGIRIRNREVLLQNFFITVEQVVVSILLPGGKWSEDITRVSVERGDSVAALLYEPAHGLLHLTNQFRYPTYDFLKETETASHAETARSNGWMVEILAGRLGDGESPAETMSREIAEESGFRVMSLTFLSQFYLSPGVSTERLFLFYAEVEVDDDIRHAPGGLGEEEFIEKIALTPEEFFDQVTNNKIQDAKTICAAHWLRQNSHVLRPAQE